MSQWGLKPVTICPASMVRPSSSSLQRASRLQSLCVPSVARRSALTASESMTTSFELWSSNFSRILAGMLSLIELLADFLKLFYLKPSVSDCWAMFKVSDWPLQGLATPIIKSLLRSILLELRRNSREPYSIYLDKIIKCKIFACLNSVQTFPLADPIEPD